MEIFRILQFWECRKQVNNGAQLKEDVGMTAAKQPPPHQKGMIGHFLTWLNPIISKAKNTAQNKRISQKSTRGNSPLILGLYPFKLMK